MALPAEGVPGRATTELGTCLLPLDEMDHPVDRRVPALAEAHLLAVLAPLGVRVKCDGSIARACANTSSSAAVKNGFGAGRKPGRSVSVKMPPGTRIRAQVFHDRIDRCRWWEGIAMLKWILILLVIAAVASLLGFHALAGAAATGARILIAVVLVLFLLVLFGVVAIA